MIYGWRQNRMNLAYIPHTGILRLKIEAVGVLSRCYWDCDSMQWHLNVTRFQYVLWLQLVLPAFSCLRLDSNSWKGYYNCIIDHPLMIYLICSLYWKLMIYIGTFFRQKPALIANFCWPTNYVSFVNMCAFLDVPAAFVYYFQYQEINNYIHFKRLKEPSLRNNYGMGCVVIQGVDLCNDIHNDSIYLYIIYIYQIFNDCFTEHAVIRYFGTYFKPWIYHWYKLVIKQHFVILPSTYEAQEYWWCIMLDCQLDEPMLLWWPSAKCYGTLLVSFDHHTIAAYGREIQAE